MIVKKFSKEISSEDGISSRSLCTTPNNKKNEIEVSLFTDYIKRTVTLFTEETGYIWSGLGLVLLLMTHGRPTGQLVYSRKIRKIRLHFVKLMDSYRLSI